MFGPPRRMLDKHSGRAISSARNPSIRANLTGENPYESEREGIFVDPVVSAAFAPPPACDGRAAGHLSSSSAHCLSFTPGVTNTITNDVIGSENTGTKSPGIACALDAATITADGVRRSPLVQQPRHHAVQRFLHAGDRSRKGLQAFISKSTTVALAEQTAVTFTPRMAARRRPGLRRKYPSAELRARRRPHRRETDVAPTWSIRRQRRFDPDSSRRVQRGAPDDGRLALLRRSQPHALRSRS